MSDGDVGRERPVPRAGLVVKGYNVWYDVDVGGEVLPCRLRGRLRLAPRGARPDAGGRGADAAADLPAPVLVGDRVRVNLAGDGTGVIEEVLPRRRVYRRPPVANVDLVVVVASLALPPLNLPLVDRLLVRACAEGLDAVLCLNKADLVAAEAAEDTARVYRRAGYAVCVTVATEGRGLVELAGLLRDRVAVVAGPSGTGKSTLLNGLLGERRLATGGLGRIGGRHTTRHVELLPLPGGGHVVDGPGFSRLDVRGVEPARVGACYPEFARLAPGCRFGGCLHHREPGCAVRAAVEAGQVDGGRYRRYLDLLAEAAGS